MGIIRRIARLMIYGSFTALVACNAGSGGIEDAYPLIDAGGNGSGQFSLSVMPIVSPRQLEATGPTTPVLNLGIATTVNGAAPVTIDVVINADGTIENTTVADGVPLSRDLPLGITDVTWTATDGNGIVQTAARRIVIQDRISPRFDFTLTFLIYINSNVGQTNVDLGWVNNVVDADPNPAISVVEVDAGGTPIGGGFTFSGIVLTPAPVVVPTVTVGTHYFAWTLSDNNIIPLATTQIQRVVVSDSIVIGPPQNLTVAQFTAIVFPTPINTTPVQLTMTVTGTTLGQALAAGGVAPYSFTNNAPNPAVGNVADANNAGNEWIFPLGTTIVTWTVVDSLLPLPANTDSAPQTVDVIDNTPPTLTVPNDVTYVSLDSNPVLFGTVPIGTATAEDNVDAQGSILPVVVNPDPATFSFPFDGTISTQTVLTWRATDSSGNFTEGTQVVTISPPAVKCSDLYNEFQTVTYPTMALDADLTTPSDNTCRGCHTPGGTRGRVTTIHDFYFDGLDVAVDFAKFKEVAGYKNGLGVSNMKSKILPTDTSGHVTVFANDQQTGYRAIAGMVDDALACVADTVNIQGVDIGTPYQRLRKATLALASRLPTAAEEASVSGAADEAAFNTELDAILTTIMNTENAFYVRLKEIYNDALLTDKYATLTDEPNGVFDLDNFANEVFFENGGANDTNAEQLGANYGIARAPLELIANVVRNNQPFTEIVTANYVMVNPYSARLFSANSYSGSVVGAGFNYPDNTDMFEFREAQVSSDVGGTLTPNTHAGVLSTLGFMTRYPSSNTNINRARAGEIMEIFLDENPHGFAARDSLDLDNIVGAVPTYQDIQCTVCHDHVDARAGLLKNWSNSGQFRGDYGNWYHNRFTSGVPQMLEPGYESRSPLFTYATPDGVTPDAAVAATRSQDSILYFGERIAADPNFAEQTVKIMFTGLTGQDPDSITGTFIADTTTDFITNNFDMKQLVKDIVMSIYFRAENLSLIVTDPASFADLGMGRLLIPEQLNRNLENIMGYTWTGPRTNDSLLDTSTYALMYGGIDSDNVTKRSTAVNRLMVGIQDRIANQTACVTVATDLINRGTLFPYAGVADTPASIAGAGAIQANIQHLHKILLGEVLGPTDPKILATNQLFVDVRDALMTATDNAIPGVCRGIGGSTDTNYTIKPWMAVVTYLLSDYEFLYE